MGPRLKLQLPIVIDRDQFLAAVSRGDLEEAVARYTGPFLPGFASPGGAESEHWMDHERERLRGVFVRAAEELVREYLTGGRFRDAHQLAERVRDADPESERAWRLVIECLLQIKRPLALAEADAFEWMLSSSQRVPSPATTALLRVVRQVPPADEATNDAGLVSQMVGRESEFAAILNLWQECSRGAARHLHLSAPAGLGKTRLLGDVATRLRSAGTTVVSLRAAYGERAIGYAFAAELARALTELPGTRGISPAAAAALVSLSPALSSIFPGAPDTATGEDALRRRTLALSELVHAAAEEQPLALLVDDTHWADDASLQIVMGILERLGAAPVMVVTASRPTRNSALRLEQSHSITLAPLSATDTTDPPGQSRQTAARGMGALAPFRAARGYRRGSAADPRIAPARPRARHTGTRCRGMELSGARSARGCAAGRQRAAPPDRTARPRLAVAADPAGDGRHPGRSQRHSPTPPSGRVRR